MLTFLAMFDAISLPHPASTISIRKSLEVDDLSSHPAKGWRFKACTNFSKDGEIIAYTIMDFVYIFSKTFVMAVVRVTK